jgi:hypothetical protein
VRFDLQVYRDARCVCRFGFSVLDPVGRASHDVEVVVAIRALFVLSQTTKPVVRCRQPCKRNG